MATSPTTIAEPLEYFTVESYSWPESKDTKQCRLKEEARKRRHRENQRRHMLRKKARIIMLRQVAIHTQLQLKYVQALCEAKMLREEQHRLEALQSEFLAMEGNRKQCRQAFEPLDVPRHIESVELDTLLTDILFTLGGLDYS